MDANGAGVQLNALLTRAGLEPLDQHTVSQFEVYISLYIRWNARINLSAIRDEKSIISIHIIESIEFARYLPLGISTLLDFGSGAGLPGIPIALCCPQIAVTLAESQGKKAAFLEEAVRTLGISAKVHAGRAETLREAFDCVVLRAVDKMPKAVSAAAHLAGPKGYLALMTTVSRLEELKGAAGAGFSFASPALLPSSQERVIAMAQRRRGD
jgi:16S rRNA (guanine527-N7)-methyltransferase